VAAAARNGGPSAEIDEPAVALRSEKAGSEVVEDYRHIGLSLRSHPVYFLRQDLRRRRIRGDGGSRRPLARSGGHRPRSPAATFCEGRDLITLEYETGIANLVVWPKVFEANQPHPA
jgi:error-prone DNA polymerase